MSMYGKPLHHCIPGHTIILGKLYAKDSALRRRIRLGLGGFLFFPPSVGDCGVWRHACGLLQIPETLSFQGNPFLPQSSLRGIPLFWSEFRPLCCQPSTATRRGGPAVAGLAVRGASGHLVPEAWFCSYLSGPSQSTE